MEKTIKEKKDVLLIVDVQCDFFSQGALPVPHAQEILPEINKLIKDFSFVVATQDWHPPYHHSFASSHENKKPFDQIELYYGMQTLWPDHCLQGSLGAQFHPELNQNDIHFILRKGYRLQSDSYSGFFENDRMPTGLANLLSPKENIRLFICGLARDYCVQYTYEDALSLGYDVQVIEQACRGIH